MKKARIFKQFVCFKILTQADTPMAQNKNINDQLKVIYNAIGLLPKINGTYLAHRRSHLEKASEKIEIKRSCKNLDLDKVKRKLANELKKQSFADSGEKKHRTNNQNYSKTLTESSAQCQFEQKIKAQAQQQKLHIIKLSEFLKLRTRSIVASNNYFHSLNKLHRRRQRAISNRTVQYGKQQKINYFLPDNDRISQSKLATLRIKINKCNVHKVYNKEEKINESKRQKRYSIEQTLMKHGFKKEGQILPKGERLTTQVCNQTKLSRWKNSQSKFRKHKKRSEKFNESWEIAQTEIYL